MSSWSAGVCWSRAPGHVQLAMETTLRLGLAVLAISSFLLLSLLFHSSSDVTNYFMRLKKVKDNLKSPLSNFVERKKASESHIPKVFQSRERYALAIICHISSTGNQGSKDDWKAGEGSSGHY